MEKLKNKNFWLILLIFALIAFVIVLLVFKSKNSKEVTKEESKESLRDKYELISEADTLYYRFENCYWREDTTFEVEKGKNKVYKIDGKDYYHLTNYDYIQYMFTEDGLKNYASLTGLLVKDNNYYLPVTMATKNDLFLERKFEIKEENDNEVKFDMISTYCDNKDTCTTKSTRTSNFVMKKVDDVWKIDQIVVDR